VGLGLVAGGQGPRDVVVDGMGLSKKRQGKRWIGGILWMIVVAARQAGFLFFHPG
jgi:hypothetical protein